MSVYVDALVKPSTGPACFAGGACHMYADSLKELHAFARQIGLKKAWFQPNKTVDHYDLTIRVRQMAVKLGAIEHDRNQAIAKWQELREARPR